MLLLLLCGFGIVLFRLVTLQVLQAAELTARADRQHQKSVTLEGARGTVTDRHGKVLAMNMEVPSIFGVPASLDNPSRAARTLSPVLHVKRDEIEKKLRQDKHFVWLARKVEPEQGRRLEQLSIDGIGMVMEGPPAAVILLPVLFPAAKAMGINPIHFNIVITAAVGVGFFLPPLGVGLLIALRFGNVSVTQHFRHYWPYVVALVLGRLVRGVAGVCVALRPVRVAVRPVCALVLHAL